jgi:hypothetical protein
VNGFELYAGKTLFSGMSYDSTWKSNALANFVPAAAVIRWGASVIRIELGVKGSVWQLSKFW